MASNSARREDHFQKILSKTDLPFKFCKIGLKILYLFLVEKMVVCCCLLLFVVVCCCLLLFVVVVVCCCLLLFVVVCFCLFLFVVCCLLQLCPILAYFFKKLKLSSSCERCFKEKNYFFWFGNCSIIKVPRFCRFTGFTKMQLT